MNKVKQELLELLEPYNSKELRLWTYMKSKKAWKMAMYCWQSDQYRDQYIMALWEYNIVSKKLLSAYEILGKLSLSALLKLIWKEIYTYTYESCDRLSIMVIYKNFRDLEDNINYIEIPNKDLEEYTLQETKDVIVIIKELLWKH